MFFLIRRAVLRALSLTNLIDRIESLEAQIQKFEGLAKENAALWEMLDNDASAASIFVGTTTEFEAEVADIIVQKMKTYGDA
jgi:hypothetical protein